MNKTLRIILTCVMVIYVFFAVSAIPNIIENRSGRKNAGKTSSVSQTRQGEEGEYLLTSFDGKIAVRETKSGKIVHLTDTSVSILPEKDRKQIERGLVVKNKTQLKKLLEDLCS